MRNAWRRLSLHLHRHWNTYHDRSARTLDNQVGQDTTGKEWSWPQVIEAFKDPQLYFSFANSFLGNIPNGQVNTQLPNGEVNGLILG